MKKTLRVLGTVLAMVLIFTSFIGCSPKAEAPKQQTGDTNSTVALKETTVDSTAATAEPASLRFSWWGGDSRHEATLNAIAQYKNVAPNITIEAEYQGWDGYQQKLSTQLAGGTAPDLIQVDSPWLPEYATRGDVFVDIYKQEEVDTTGFDETFLKSFVVFDGKLVGLPMGINGRTIIINKELSDKTGVAIAEGTDWEDLITLAEKLREVDKKYYLLNSDIGVLNQAISSILKQKTGSNFINDDYTVAYTEEDLKYALSWLKRAFEAGVFQPIAESALFFNKTDQNPKWINGDFIGVEDWSSGVSKMKSTLPAIAVATPPALKDGKTGAAIVRPSMVLCISSDSKNISESAKFTNWLLNDKDAALILGDQRAVPASELARKAAGEAGKIDKDVVLAVENAQKSTQFPDNTVSTNTQLADIQKDIVQRVLFEEITVEKGATEIITRFKEKVEELKSAAK